MKNESWKQYTDADILARVSVRPIEPDGKAGRDQRIRECHYLKNAHLVGRQLRDVAELDGQWVGLLGWNVAAYPLKGREGWIDWGIGKRLKRRKFIAQNSRFLLLVQRGRYPNLASRVLGLCCRRLSQDWQKAFGTGGGRAVLKPRFSPLNIQHKRSLKTRNMAGSSGVKSGRCRSIPSRWASVPRCGSVRSSPNVPPASKAMRRSWPSAVSCPWLIPGPTRSPCPIRLEQRALETNFSTAD